MKQKMYKTAQGKMVDIGEVLLRNEHVRAIGNMGVNARGDVVDNKNKKIQSRNSQVNKQYRKQISNRIVDEPIQNAQPASIEEEEVKINEIVGLDEPIVEAKVKVKPTVKPETTTKGGLASAIAKARQVEQKPSKSARQEVRERDGVKKI